MLSDDVLDMIRKNPAVAFDEITIKYMRELIGGDDPWSIVEEAHQANPEVGKIKLYEAIGLHLDIPPNDRGVNGGGFAFVPVEALMTNPKPLPWLIKGFIPAGCIGQVFGDPEAGKSLLALWMATCVATGADWDGEEIKQQGDVIYLAGEGKYGLPQRMKALSMHHVLNPTGMHFSELPAALNVKAEAEMVSQAIDELGLESVSMIIVDTLHRHMNGDENSSKDFGELLRTLDAYRLKYDCTILIIHHSGHGDKKRSRGSSSLRGAWDFEYCLTLDNGVVEMTCEKSKDFVRPKPRHYLIEQVGLPWADEDG